MPHDFNPNEKPWRYSFPLPATPTPTRSQVVLERAAYVLLAASLLGWIVTAGYLTIR